MGGEGQSRDLWNLVMKLDLFSPSHEIMRYSQPGSLETANAHCGMERSDASSARWGRCCRRAA